MASFIPGYEYDIFISYRHKDNEYDGWVTEFVSNLRKELHATFKEEVSIYFDENPQDGILESHQVGGTVHNKIRCAIFIPILSQTYCDVNSFAWQHEFLEFNRIAGGDDYGREIRLLNGNVSSRILPVRIHDLDAEDKELFEKETGAVLRSIDFIYRAAGVNRPLKPNDDRGGNQNHTYYRDQINKVANAVKEIIGGIRNAVTKGPVVTLLHEQILPAHASVPSTSTKRKIIGVSGILLVVVTLLGIYSYSSRDLEVSNPREASIAVLPFANLSNDPQQEYFSDGITDEIRTSISHLDNVKVIARTSVMKYKGTRSDIPEIGKALGVNYILEGSIQKAGNRIRINAQLIRVEGNFHEWADVFDGELTDIFKLQDEVSNSIAQTLGKKLNNTRLVNDRPSNTEAYDHFLRAKYVAINHFYWSAAETNESFFTAKKLYEKAIELDSGFGLAYAGLADLYGARRNLEGADFPEELNQLRLKLSKKAYQLDPNSAFVNNVRAYMYINADKPDLDSGHYFLRRAVELDPADAYVAGTLATFYFRDGLGLYDQALPYLLRAREINPEDSKVYAELGYVYLHLGNVREAARAFEAANALGGNEDYRGKAHVIYWLLLDRQVSKAEAIIRSSEVYHNPLWNSLLDAAKGNKTILLKEKIRIYPHHYLLMGMKKEALQGVDIAIDKGEDWYLGLVNHPGFRTLNSEPDYERVLAKAKILHEKYLARFGFK